MNQTSPPSAKRLSICMLSDDFLPAATGVGTHLQEVSKLLTRAGNRVTIITTRRPGEPAEEIWEGVRVFRVFTLKAFGFYQALPSTSELRRILDEARPDIIHYHYLGLMLIRAMKLAETLGLPQVYTYHMTEDHLTQPLPMRPFRKLIAKEIVSVCNRANLVISVSQGIADQLPGKGIRTPVRYISNPVSFPDDVAIAAAPRDAAFAVLFAGRLNPEKNIPFLLRSFAIMTKQIPDSILWIAGHGSQKDQLLSQAKELGIGDKVQFLGFLGHDQLSRYYAACDVFVLPSLVETQGLVAMEAMWFGKPILVADSVVSARELVDQGNNGYIVDHESDASLAERLLELATQPDLRARMGNAGRTKTLGYRPPVILEALQSAYGEILQASGSHR